MSQPAPRLPLAVTETSDEPPRGVQTQAEYPGGQPIIVELVPAQIAQIMRTLAGTATISVVLAGLRSGDAICRRELEDRYSAQLKDGALSRSLTRGLIVLGCFLPDIERGIAELAEQLELNISTTHRYVSTLAVLGVLDQRATRKYRPQTASGLSTGPRVNGSGTASLAVGESGEGASGPQVQLVRSEEPGGRRVAVELFPVQIDQIMRTVENAAGPSIADLLAAVVGDSLCRTDLEVRYAAQLKDGALSRGLMRGLIVLACFVPGGTERGISELARQLKLNISTTHRYVTTLVVLGILERSANRKYRLALGMERGTCKLPVTETVPRPLPNSDADTPRWRGAHPGSPAPAAAA